MPLVPLVVVPEPVEPLELPVPFVADVEPLPLVESVLLEELDESLLLEEFEPLLVLELDPVELVVELEPELLLELELLLLESLFELLFPELEDVPELLVVESVVLPVVSEFELVSVVWAESDSADFSDLSVSSGFSASVCSFVVCACSVAVVSCVRPGVVPMPLP